MYFFDVDQKESDGGVDFILGLREVLELIYFILGQNDFIIMILIVVIIGVFFIERGYVIFGYIQIIEYERVLIQKKSIRRYI